MIGPNLLIPFQESVLSVARCDENTTPTVPLGTTLSSDLSASLTRVSPAQLSLSVTTSQCSWAVSTLHGGGV